MFGIINDTVSIVLSSLFSKTQTVRRIFWSFITAPLSLLTAPLKHLKKMIATVLWIYIEVAISLFAWMFPQPELGVGKKRESHYNFSFFSWQPTKKAEERYKEEIRKRDNRIADLQSEIERLKTPLNSRPSSVGEKKVKKSLKRRRTPSVSCSPLKIVSSSAIRDYFELDGAGADDSDDSLAENMEDMHGWAELTLAWNLYKEAKRESPDGDLSSLMSAAHSRHSSKNSMKITPEALKMLDEEDDSDNWAGSVDADALTSVDAGELTSAIVTPQVMNLIPQNTIDIPPAAARKSADKGIEPDRFEDVLKAGFLDMSSGKFEAVVGDKNSLAESTH